MAEKPKLTTLYTTEKCSYCVAAKRLLEQLGWNFQMIDLTHNMDLRQKLSAENNGYRTVPMVYVDGRFIGGYSELVTFSKSLR